MRKKAFTIVELLLVMALIIALMTVGLLLLNPQEQFARSKDAIRKNDLHTLRNIFEDWKDDKGCYPKLLDVCSSTLSSTTCEICTSKAGSPSFAPYSNSTICDPESPRRDYLYKIQGDATCPSAFLVYTKLGASYVRSNDIYNCTSLHACGPAPFYGYDYLVSSPNAYIEVAGTFFCIRHTDQQCVVCGTYSQCIAQVNNYNMGRQAACYDENKIYANPSCI